MGARGPSAQIRAAQIRANKVNFFFKFATLITGEPNKIESFATTGFEDNDPNCAVGYAKNPKKVT